MQALLMADSKSSRGEDAAEESIRHMKITCNQQAKDLEELHKKNSQLQVQ